MNTPPYYHTTLTPRPLVTVQLRHLVVVLHQLDDDADVVAVVLDGDDAHDVGRVLRVRILAVLVGQDEAGIRVMDLAVTSGQGRSGQGRSDSGRLGQGMGRLI